VAFLPSLSTDAQFITFSSSSTNLVNDDDNGNIFDVFIRDLSTGEVTRVSERSFPGAGIAGGDADSFGSAVSTNGSVVAFDSEAENLGGTVSGTRDVFVTEPGSAGIDLVSITGNQFGVNPSISADGTLVAFQSTATGLAGTPDAVSDTQIPRIFLRDLTDDSLTDLSTAATGPEDFADESSFDPDISADGAFVVFESDATNLVADDALGFRDIFIKEVDGGGIRLVSLTQGDSQGFGGSSDASVSGDGSVVAFESRASFEAADINEERDIYVKDLDSGELNLVSIGLGGIVADGPSFSPSISDDGNLVAFISEASNLVEGDDNGIADVFVADLTNGDILRFELDSDTSGANRELVEPELSGDGSFVAYLSGVEVAESGALTESQVTVAPVDFGPAPASVAALDTLITQPDVV
jgi:Tol biopolymer transport system component